MPSGRYTINQKQLNQENFMINLQAHLFAIAAPILASISQIIIKWQTNQVSSFPDEFTDKVWFIADFLLRPWVLFAMLATFASGVSWIIAMTKLDLSYAYPYVAATFIIVPLLAILLLGESISTGKIIGGILILSGIAVVMTKG